MVLPVDMETTFTPTLPRFNKGFAKTPLSFDTKYGVDLVETCVLAEPIGVGVGFALTAELEIITRGFLSSCAYTLGKVPLIRKQKANNNENLRKLKCFCIDKV